MNGKHAASLHNNSGGKKILSHLTMISEKQRSEGSFPLWNAIPIAVIKLIFTQRGNHKLPKHL